MGKGSTFLFLCFAALYVVPNGSHATKQLIPKITYCGPDIKVWFEPDPVLLISGLMVNGSLTMKAAHSMLMGTIEAHLDIWPYHLKSIYCEDGTTTVDPKGCYMKKGEIRTLGFWTALDGSFASLFTKSVCHGNVTVHNEYGELMLCVRLTVQVNDV
ncbi:uncharacterized protein LOC117295284 isoform X1 [Asterias rubens]|uniref:uncharacterized protein LOC117295284 isoform X1 n=1 Tax=Asterias rubens TaxID=7604 RepID=UPI00145595E8|nr:uncharacterized protein LOC117295284 isoform X1 [Asterias rubens]